MSKQIELIENLQTENTANTANMAKTDNLIDLVKFSSSILDNPTIQEKLSQNIPVILTGKNLLGKLPDLKPLENLSLLQVKKSKNGLPMVLVPNIYLENKKLVVCLPDLNASITDDLVIQNLNIVHNDSYAIVSNKENSVFLKINIGLNSVAVTQCLIDETIGLVDIKDFLLDEYLYLFKQRPIIELPLSVLDLHTDYQILTLGDNSSKEYDTPLMAVKNVKTGKVFENVLTNADINRNGEVNSIFQIINSQEFKTTKKQGKKEVTSLQTKYFIKWHGLDFSDLKI